MGLKNREWGNDMGMGLMPGDFSAVVIRQRTTKVFHFGNNRICLSWEIVL
jgi:hypothetical protein